MQFKESKVILIPDKQTDALLLQIIKLYKTLQNSYKISLLFPYILVFYVYLFRPKKSLQKRSCWCFDSRITLKDSILSEFSS